MTKLIKPYTKKGLGPQYTKLGIKINTQVERYVKRLHRKYPNVHRVELEYVVGRAAHFGSIMARLAEVKF